MTDLSTCSTPNETINKVTIDIYKAVENVKLYTISSFCYRVIGGGVQLAVSAHRPENLKIRSVKLSSLIRVGVFIRFTLNLKI